MRILDKGKYLAGAGVLLLLFNIIFFSWLYADNSSTNVSQVTVNPQMSSTGTVCTYHFIDVYDGTVMPGSAGVHPRPTGTSFALNFYNNVYDPSTQTTSNSPSTESTPLTCDGTFEVIFNVVLQANTDVQSITITPKITNASGQLIYPSNGAAATAKIYPECNNGNFTGKPYCTVSSITGAVQLPLKKGDQISAPTLQASSSVTVVGGSFEVIYLHP